MLSHDLNTEMHTARYIEADTVEEVFAKALDLAPDNGEPWLHSLNMHPHYDVEAGKLYYTAYLIYGGF